MDRIQVFVKVVAEVEEKKLTLSYEGEDGKTHKKTTVEKSLIFPEVECAVKPIGFNPEKNEEQMWLLEGERMDIVPLFDKVTPLTMAQAGELSAAWGGAPSVRHLIVSATPLFQPKE